MIFPRHILFAALAVLLLAIPADGREFVLGVEQSLTADSNIFAESGEENADGSYRIGPTVRFRENRDALSYDFYYKPMYQVYMVTDDINGVNHTYVGALDWELSARDEIKLSSSAILRRAVQLLDDAGGDPGVEIPGIGDTGRYLIDLTYRRSFTDRIVGNVKAGYEQWTYSNDRSIPNISGFGGLSGSWVPLQNLQTGVDTSVRYRRFEEVGASPTSTNVIATGSVFANWTISERWKAVAALGPTWVAQKQDAPGARQSNRFQAFESAGQVYAAPFSECTVDPIYGVPFLANCGDSTGANFLPASAVDPSETVAVDFAAGTPTSSTSDDFFTFFANAEIEYEWARGSAGLGYSRSQDASGGVSSTNIRDAITLRAVYFPVRHTELRLYSSWSKRRSSVVQSLGLVSAVSSGVPSDPPGAEALAEANPELTLVNVDRKREIDQFRLSAKALRQLTENLEVGAEFAYTWQSSNVRATDLSTGQLSSPGDRRFNRYIGRVVMRYVFDSFRF